MSKNNNVNPDYYKVAGRDRGANAVAKAPQSGAGERETKERERFEKRQQQKKKR